MNDFSAELKKGINSSRDFANGRKMAGAGFVMFAIDSKEKEEP